MGHPAKNSQRNLTKVANEIEDNLEKLLVYQ